MTKIDFHNTCAIVLAAGKGTRMKAGNVNKVTLPIAGTPIIIRIVTKLKDAGIKDIFVVVGHAKESVINLLGKSVNFVEQEEQLGTGHAVRVALSHVPKNFENIFVFYGDDTSYDRQILENLYKRHKKNNNCLSFLTIDIKDPTGLGRIKRDKEGRLIGIIEEKDATKEEKMIKEVNPGCFIFKRWFLDKYIEELPKNKITKEYYITDLIGMGIEKGEKVEGVKEKYTKWQGFNTLEELQKADKILQVKK